MSNGTDRRSKDNASDEQEVQRKLEQELKKSLREKRGAGTANFEKPIEAPSNDVFGAKRRNLGRSSSE